MTTNRPLRRALVSVYHKEGIEVLAQAFIQAGTEVVSTGSTAAKLKELGVTNRPLRRALVSVYHKEGIEVLAQAFIQAGTEVVSTGSTAAKLKELGVQVTEVSQVTGFPECLDGRVKTLDPHIHAGILADMTNPDHAQQLESFGIKPFDLVVVNLYPFADTVRSGANPDHAQQLESFGIKPFDLVVVNLYPFADTVRSGADNAAIIEKIDIGGPSMVRGAAKNSATVAIVTDPADYALVAGRIADGTGFSLDERRWLAGKAFAHTAAYDATINEWTSAHWPKPASIEDNSEDADAMEEAKLKQFPQTYTRSWDRAHVLINEWTSAHWPKPASIEDNSEDADAMEEAKLKQFPQTYTRSWDRAHVLRYGENPHQDAALYLDPLNTRGFANAEQLGGKPMSYNNYVDADAAWRAVWDFAPQIAVAVVKHNNPCGLAVAATAAEAHRKAHACDPMSAYGGVIATNSTVTLDMAQSVRPIFTEVIVAPDYEPEALALLQAKKKNLRILKVAEPPKSKLQFRQIDGGLLVQSTDLIDATGDMPDAWKLVAGEAADEQTLKELEFAWRAVRCVKSNAILIADDMATVGIGMGQVNRVDSANLAVERANTLDEGRNRTQGAVAASDAFFPFADGAQILIDAGVKAIVQPGGSIRDETLDEGRNRTQGAVAASDAFFPFADGAQILIDAGVKAIVQPGGSIRDEEVFEAARKANVTMYVTGTRHFFH